MAQDGPFRVYRVSNALKELASEHLRQMHDAIARSRELLRGVLPDTFLGRKSQEPFPDEDMDYREERRRMARKPKLPK
jgi:hypothetical protein